MNRSTYTQDTGLLTYNAYQQHTVDDPLSCMHVTTYRMVYCRSNVLGTGQTLLTLLR